LPSHGTAHFGTEKSVRLWVYIGVVDSALIADTQVRLLGHPMKKDIKINSDRCVVFYPALARALGDIESAIYYQQLHYWGSRGKRKDGFIYKTKDEIYEETAIKEKQQDRIRQELIQKGWISTKKVMANGSPTIHYKCLVDVGVVIDQPPQTGGTNLLTEEVPISSGRGFESPMRGDSITETTTEITTDIPSTNVEGSISSEKGLELPVELGKQPLQRLLGVYALIWKSCYGTEYKETNWGLIGRLYKPLLASYSEHQIAALIILHFNWHGASGTDEFTYKRLSENFFPLTWIPKSVNQYKTYLINEMKIDFDDPIKIKKWVEDHITSIKTS
jgi:hypothetical protein